MKPFRLAVALSVCVLPGWAGYSYYLADTNLVNYWQHWNSSGAIQADYYSGSNGSYSGVSAPLQIDQYIAGVLISKDAVPDGTNSYEVKVTLRGAGGGYGGTASIFLRASADTAMNGEAGTFYEVRINGPYLMLLKRVNENYSQLGYTVLGSYHDGIQYRAVMRDDGQIVVYADNVLVMVVHDTSITSGKPGIGVANTEPGSIVTEVDLGLLDRIVPSGVNPQSIGTSSFSNRVDMQWQGVADDVNGVGISNFQVLRDGVPLTTRVSTTFSDVTVVPSHTYNYQIIAFDYHLNQASASFTVVTPPAGSIDPRRVGVRPTGAYWGAMGEQIDMLSGNLNYSLPLLKAVGRGGWGVGFNIVYNSTNWRQDPGGIWNLGRDVGYGYGWRLLAGSLTPYYSSYWVLDHYTFADSTGAEYRLDQNSNGIWTSKESIYLTFDSNTQRLYFQDGTFWIFGSTSGGTEQDSGTMYPTLMQDTNGNQIIVRYDVGAGLTAPNTSARIIDIEDVRAVLDSGVYRTYKFTYDGTKHIAGITNLIGTSEGYTFGVSTLQNLVAPFSSTGFGQTQVLQSVALTGLSVGYTIQQDSTGALTRVTLPYGGYLGWQFSNYQYVGTRLQPEVQNRYLSKDGSIPSQTTYQILRDPADSNRNVHQFAYLLDPGNVGAKVWFFYTDSSQFNVGLLVAHEDRQFPGPTIVVRRDYTWTQDSVGNPFLSTALTTVDPGANQTQKKVTQSIDTHGNLTAMNVYDFGNLTTPARSYTYYYLSDANYTSRYIYNRVTSVWLFSQQLIGNAYDNQATGGCASYGASLSNASGQREHDDVNYGTSFFYRGNLTANSRLDGTACASYNILGNSQTQIDPLGRSTSVSTSSGTNFAVPNAISTGGVYSDTFTYSAALKQTSDTNQNGGASTVQFDAFSRPTQTTSPNGAVTTYAYSTSPVLPATITATTNGRWTKTTLDGLGRTLKAEQGYGTGSGATLVSTVEYEYDSFGCLPTGRLKRQSMPYAPNATKFWTSYTYDGLGRTLTVVSPDNASTITYSYLANTVTKTDPAGHWKIFKTDAMGNLTKVTEPDPSAAAPSLITDYTYTTLSQLTNVSMTRSGGNQNRSFIYSGVFLTQSSTPESGSVNYTYNTNGTLAYKIDAKNQKTAYNYDYLGRVIGIDRYPVSSGQADPAQSVSFTWDTQTVTPDFPFGSYAGRLTGIHYTIGSSSGRNTVVHEMYGYNPAGQVTAKAMQLGQYSVSSLLAYWAYDNEGRLTSVHYPDTNTGTGANYNYAYDTMGRLNGMSDGGGSTLVNGITYGPAGELKNMSYLGYTEARIYNSGLQMTRLTTTGATDHIDFEYRFSPSQNNGKITQMKDWVTGEEVSYTYDTLNRLATAVTTTDPAVTQWGQGFSFDGFGNLLGVNVIKGSAPSMQVVVNLNNRIQGGSYDANGNDTSVGTYNVENQLVQAGAVQYGYLGPKRVWKAIDGNWSNDEFYFWSPAGQRMGTFKLNGNPGGYFTTASTNLYFGGRLIKAQGTAILTDRLGSNVTGGRRYYPLGQEKPSVTNNNIEKFTGYFRDAETGLDYANQRYHSPGFGRFTSPDPTGGDSSMPLTLNRYSYAGGDPVNNTDPSGLTTMYGGTTCGNGPELCAQAADGFFSMGGNPADQAFSAYNQMVSETFLVNTLNSFAQNGNLSVSQAVNALTSIGVNPGNINVTISLVNNLSLDQLQSGSQATCIVCTPVITYDLRFGGVVPQSEDPAIYGIFGMGQQILQATGQQLNNMSVGAFVYVDTPKKSSDQVQGAIMFGFDSRTGFGLSGIYTVGNIAGGELPVGGQSPSSIYFLPVFGIPKVFETGLVYQPCGAIGVYVGGVVGGGYYLNTGCH